MLCGIMFTSYVNFKLAVMCMVLFCAYTAQLVYQPYINVMVCEYVRKATVLSANSGGKRVLRGPSDVATRFPTVDDLTMWAVRNMCGNYEADLQIYQRLRMPGKKFLTAAPKARGRARVGLGRAISTGIVKCRPFVYSWRSIQVVRTWVA